MTDGVAEDEIRQPTKKLTVGEGVAIEMVAVHKWYGEFHVLKDINLTVNAGERIVICGPSVSGKSSLIHCINRLDEIIEQNEPHEFFNNPQLDRTKLFLSQIL